MNAIRRHLEWNLDKHFRQQEAVEGIVAEPYMGNVCKDDHPLEDSGLWCDEIPVANYFADVPFPNPVSGDEE